MRDDSLFLGAYHKDGVASLLFTVSAKQKFQFCSKCPSKKCKCFQPFQKTLDEAMDPDESADFYWKRKRTERPEPSDHFLEIDSRDDYFAKHGFNLTNFEYPIKRDTTLRDKFVERINGNFHVPGRILPTLDPSAVCEKHASVFSSSTESLQKISSNVKVFTETSEFVLNSETFGRPTDGDCRCVLQPDTHDLLLWNCGNGKVICYTFLHSSVHKMWTGTAMNAIYNSRAATLGSLGLQTTLTVKDLTKAITGFIQMLKFSNEDFLCTTCGDTPEYIVCDGKSIGPAKRKVEHLSEFDRAEEDLATMQQGSKFKDRVFLGDKQERDLVKNLLLDNIPVDEFIESEFSTANGQLVLALVTRVAEDSGEIPAPYKKFLRSIGKYTSVAGYLQVLSEDPLLYLSSFCRQQLDLRSSINKDKLVHVMEALPVLWPTLLEILNLEKLRFLPNDVAAIVLSLVKIRNETFRNAARRDDEDYVPWESIGEEHPTQFYPNWNIFRYPKKYEVSKTTDSDFCDKVSKS